jgi:hypothetical protein
MKVERIQIRMTIELDAEDLAHLGSMLSPTRPSPAAGPPIPAQVDDRLLTCRRRVNTEHLTPVESCAVRGNWSG